jgi:hypothetical protein
MDLSPPEEQLTLKRRQAPQIRTAGGCGAAPKLERLEPLAPGPLFKIRLRAFC